MKQLAIFINIAGPIDMPKEKGIGGLVHQIEMGVAEKGNIDPQAVRLIVPTSDPGKALDAACKAMKGFLKDQYDQGRAQSPPSKIPA